MLRRPAAAVAATRACSRERHAQPRGLPLSAGEPAADARSCSRTGWAGQGCQRQGAGQVQGRRSGQGPRAGSGQRSRAGSR
eukprot:2487298-Pleurochrysis_carterae.AAC.1